MLPRAAALVPAAVVVCLALTACGRKATEADCQLIVDRSVELQMKQMAKDDPTAIQKRQEQLRHELEDTMKADCIGRRVSDKMMACVKNAQTSKDLEECAR